MNQQSEQVLSRLASDSWFRAIGEPFDSPDCAVVGSWEQAVEACEDRRSSGAAIEAANRLREAILAVSIDRFRLWNKIVVNLRPEVKKLVKKKAGPYLKLHALPEVVFNHINWDILHWCMEQEYADIVPRGFYSAIGELYLDGHFPCGWRGKYPKGKLVVY